MGEENIASLQRSWRKVASTHDLQSLTEDVAETRCCGGWRAKLLGLGLLVAGTLIVMAFGLSMLVKLLPPSSDRLLSSLQQDWYYCMLLPLTLPITYIAIVLNWFSLKLFKHNS